MAATELRGHGCQSCKLVVDQGIVDHSSIEQGGVWGEDLPLEFRAQHGTLELVGVPIPITQEDVLSIGGFHESQESAEELGVGWPLGRFIGLEVDRDHQDRSGLGFP